MILTYQNWSFKKKFKGQYNTYINENWAKFPLTFFISQNYFYLMRVMSND